MALDTFASSTRQTPVVVEPSRAWILGLVVESDGSVSGPASEHVEWSSCECAGDCAVDHEHATA